MKYQTQLRNKNVNEERPCVVKYGTNPKYKRLKTRKHRDNLTQVEYCSNRYKTSETLRGRHTDETKRHDGSTITGVFY